MELNFHVKPILVVISLLILFFYRYYRFPFFSLRHHRRLNYDRKNYLHSQQRSILYHRHYFCFSFFLYLINNNYDQKNYLYSYTIFNLLLSFFLYLIINDKITIERIIYTLTFAKIFDLPPFSLLSLFFFSLLHHR